MMATSAGAVSPWHVKPGNNTAANRFGRNLVVHSFYPETPRNQNLYGHHHRIYALHCFEAEKIGCDVAFIFSPATSGMPNDTMMPVRK
jgi:hypothetical protein